MEQAEHIAYWLKSAEHDLESAETLFQHQRYDWCLFQGALSMVVATDVDNKIKEFIQLASQDLKLEAIYLFGSQARGKAHEWSDIDLAIVSSDFCGDRFDDSTRLIPYILKVDTAIEVHPFRPEEFSADNPFVQEILDTGIRVY